MKLKSMQERVFRVVVDESIDAVYFSLAQPSRSKKVKKTLEFKVEHCLFDINPLGNIVGLELILGDQRKISNSDTKKLRGKKNGN